MNRTFAKIMMAYVFMTTIIFMAVGSLTSSASTSSTTVSAAGSWLAGFVIGGANAFIKQVLAIG